MDCGHSASADTNRLFISGNVERDFDKIPQQVKKIL